MADDLINITDSEDLDVNKARLKSDNIKWLLSKRKAHTYGDRLDVNIKQTVDISGALDAAKQRVLDAARDVTSPGETSGDNLLSSDVDDLLE